jgi:uncharacterized protein with GYD domain
VATYVSLISWTEQGIRNYRDSVQRADDFRSLVEKVGGRVRELVWTVGEYDIVSVIEAPDDESLTALLLQLGQQGTVRTKTMRGFDAQQMAAIIERAG